MIRGFEVDCDEIQVKAPPYFSAVLYNKLTKITKNRTQFNKVSKIYEYF